MVDIDTNKLRFEQFSKTWKCSNAPCILIFHQLRVSHILRDLRWVLVYDFCIFTIYMKNRREQQVLSPICVRFQTWYFQTLMQKLEVDRCFHSSHDWSSTLTGDHSYTFLHTQLCFPFSRMCDFICCNY